MADKETRDNWLANITFGLSVSHFTENIKLPAKKGKKNVLNCVFCQKL
jgi:hypothetical protein